MTRSWSHAARTIDAVPLYRLRIEAAQVDPLRHLALPGQRAGYLEGVAAVHLEPDDFGSPAHRVEWREQRGGSWFTIGYAADEPGGEQDPAADPRVEDVMRRLDRGRVGVLTGDPVSLLAAEVRRLRGLSPDRPTSGV